MRLFILLAAMLVPSTVPASPYYFVAIHCEPPVVDALDANYLALRRMVEKANRSGVRLTIMFAAPWAKYIAESPQRMAEVRIWRSQGHEIGAHHHGIDHGVWDGYTDYEGWYADMLREQKGLDPYPYNGTLQDLIRDLRPLGGPLTSGCMNDEEDKAELPKEIIYDTCSGYANFAAAGRRVSDIGEPMKGVNEFVTAGWWDGVFRRWIAHYRITDFAEQVGARDAFMRTPEGGVYGVAFHAMRSHASAFGAYLDFLSGQDPGARKSLTVREIIESRLLPERLIDVVQFPAE